jgi:hypothetical protein
MDESVFSSPLIFFVANFFVTFFVIGLIAAGISLLKKPKPLGISTVAEAFFSYYLLFAIRVEQSGEFYVPRLLWGHSGKIHRMGKQPFSGRGGIRESRCGNRGSHRVQGQPAISFCYSDPAIVLLMGRRWRSRLPDDRGAQFLAG